MKNWFNEFQGKYFKINCILQEIMSLSYARGLKPEITKDKRFKRDLNKQFKLLYRELEKLNLKCQ